MTSAMPTINVGELVRRGEAHLQTGPFGTQLHAHEYVESGVPVINVRNIGMGTIRGDKLEFIKPETRDRLSGHVLRQDDIVFGRKGAVERHVLIRPEQIGWFQGSDCLRLRLNTKRVDPLFASYFFLTQEHQQWMKNQCSHGATMASLNQGILERIELPAPELSIQRRIAGILSAYDDLIENNQRRIKILEEMARSLYREWFVHFRYPGHENVPLVDSALGPIPRGWSIRKLGELTATQYGYTESAQTADIGPLYLRGMDINKRSFIDWSEVPHCPISAEDKDRYALRRGDILVIRMADPGKIGIVEEPVDAVFASYLIRVSPTSPLMMPYYLFYLMCSEGYQNYVTGASTGTTRKSASAGVITDYQFAMPHTTIVHEFVGRIGAIRRLLTALLHGAQNLRTTRDLLLPRLLSGQLDVSSLPDPVP